MKLEDNDFEEKFDKFLNEQTAEDILIDLVKSGLELSKEDKEKWIDPLIIDTPEEAEALITAMERAAAAQRKEIQVKYEEVEDPDIIRKIFNIEPVECWETTCLRNSACDIYEPDRFDKDYPCCCKYDLKCPNRIRSIEEV